MMIILATEHFTLLERETIDSDCCWLFFFVLLKGLCYKNTAVFLFYSVGQFYAEVSYLHCSASSHTQNASVVLLRKARKESWPNFFKFQSMSILAIHATDPQLTGISFNA